MKRKEVIFLAIITMNLISCVHLENVPYVISEPECRIGSIESEHEFVGIHFSFYNNSEKIVSGFKCTFLVFDSTGEKSPLLGSNILSARYSQTVESNQMQDVVLSLDRYISHVPTEPYIIDFFYVTDIEYDDGTTWSDPYGAWIPGSL